MVGIYFLTRFLWELKIVHVHAFCTQQCSILGGKSGLLCKTNKYGRSPTSSPHIRYPLVTDCMKSTKCIAWYRVGAPKTVPSIVVWFLPTSLISLSLNFDSKLLMVFSHLPLHTQLHICSPPNRRSGNWLGLPPGLYFPHPLQLMWMSSSQRNLTKCGLCCFQTCSSKPPMCHSCSFPKELDGLEVPCWRW